MFDEGTPSEAALNKLDKKLEILIKKARENPEVQNDYQDAKSSGARSNGSRGAEVRRSFQAASRSESNGFQKTGLSVLKPTATSKDILNGGRVVYEDPAAALNVSEDAWNKIV